MVSDVTVSEAEIEQNDLMLANEAEAEQTVTYRGLSVSKKAWVVRLSLFFALIFLICNNVIVALEINDPFIVYSTLMPIQTISIFFIGWFFFRNLSDGKSVRSQELVSVIIPIFNTFLRFYIKEFLYSIPIINIV